MNLVRSVSLSVIAAMLASCGGGGGGGTAATPPPPTTPTPPPTNTNLANLQYSQSFPTVQRDGRATLSSTGAVTGTPSATTAVDSFNVDYNAASQSYTVRIGADAATFGPADRTTDSNATISVFERVAGNQTDTFVLFNVGASNPALALTYVSYGALQRITNQGSPFDVRSNIFVYGIRTLAADMPRTGSASYTTRIDGTYAGSDGIFSLDGASSFAANFAASTIDYSMTPVGTNVLTGTPKTFGTTSGTGTITLGTTGAFQAGAGANAQGFSSSVTGNFFGPGAAEMGGVFALTGADGTGGGAIVGRKN